MNWVWRILNNQSHKPCQRKFLVRIIMRKKRNKIKMKINEEQYGLTSWLLRNLENTKGHTWDRLAFSVLQQFKYLIHYLFLFVFRFCFSGTFLWLVMSLLNINIKNTLKYVNDVISWNHVNVFQFHLRTCLQEETYPTCRMAWILWILPRYSVNSPTNCHIVHWQHQLWTAPVIR